MSHQEALTVISDIRPEAMDSLQQLLRAMSEDAANNEVIPFGRLSSVHFARLLILPEAKDLKGAVIGPKLVLSTNVDAPLGAHLDELVDVAGSGLDEVFGHCQGYPTGNATRERRLAYLKERMVKAQAFYVNTVGRTVKQVRREAQLRAAIEDFLDRHDWTGKDPLEVRKAIQDFVEGEPSLGWLRESPERPELGWRVRQRVKKYGIPLGLAALTPFTLPALPVLAAILRYKEKTDVPSDAKPTSEHIRRISEGEDFFAQNPFSGVGFIKPGVFRHSTVRFVLWLTKYGAEHLYNNGSLTGVKTIHFARWVIIDDGRRTLFMSNYDGSLESYMSDFIDKVAWGLNAVFSNGVGWPRTDWLIKGGAENELEFKSFLRNHQLPTQVWYTAYGDLTTVNISNNTAIRKGLSGSMSRQEAEEWLRRL